MAAYEVTMKYRVELEKGAEAAITLEFEDDDTSEILTELFAEVMHDYQATTDIGERKSTWLYLKGAEEQWSEGWHLLDDLPSGWEGTTEEMARYLQCKKHSSVRAVVNVTTKNSTWMWGGE